AAQEIRRLSRRTPLAPCSAAALPEQPSCAAFLQFIAAGRRTRNIPAERPRPLWAGARLPGEHRPRM
ncbi:MAG: hypothetical protein AVDCRST_MAG08-3948, partial [uncultured Acetobacteraceae bacterium]